MPVTKSFWESFIIDVRSGSATAVEVVADLEICPPSVKVFFYVYGVARFLTPPGGNNGFLLVDNSYSRRKT